MTLLHDEPDCPTGIVWWTVALLVLLLLACGDALPPEPAELEVTDQALSTCALVDSESLPGGLVECHYDCDDASAPPIGLWVEGRECPETVCVERWEEPRRWRGAWHWCRP